jgi:hypothetical protein
MVDNSSVLISMRSVQAGKPWLKGKDVPTPKKEKGSPAVTLEIPRSHVLLTPLSANQTLVQMLFTSDPQLDYVP